jgi:LCP family protein required for cell wall assembly
MRRNKDLKSGKSKFARGVGYGLFLLVALGIGSTAGWINQSKVFVSLLKDGFNPDAPRSTFKADTITLLILGCDEDLAPGGKKVLKKQARSDMMLVCKLDFTNKMVTGVSIPRDTRCKLPGHRDQKINGYHNIAKKGHEAELTQQAVEHLLPGVKIDKVVTLDFDHFQDMVNLVGGVPINVEKNLKYDDNAGSLHIHLSKGYQVMNGYNAMCFVRFRHGDTDFERQKRQKQFLASFKQQAIKDWLHMPEIVNEAEKMLGGALRPEEIASLAVFARSVPPENIQWGQIPVVDGPGTDLLVDEDKLPSVLAQYRLVDAGPANKPSDEASKP